MDDTTRFAPVDHAVTRVFRPTPPRPTPAAPAPARAPAPAPRARAGSVPRAHPDAATAIVLLDPEARRGLAHPRLVRRAQPLPPAPRQLERVSRRDEFDDGPTARL